MVRKYTKSGNIDQLGDLYNRYIELQYGLCFKYLKNREKAEDAVMSIFEELVTKLPKHKIENFRSWLYTLTKNHCLMELRKEKKMLSASNEMEEDMHFEDFLHPSGKELKEEEFLNLEGCIDKLPEMQQKCIKFHYFEKKTYNEIAEILGKKNDKIRSYIQNGRRNLKNCLKKKSEKVT